MTFPHDILEPRPGVRIAYRKTVGKSKTLPGVVFLGGYGSDMQGSKATYLEERCAKRNQGYLRFDYQGHGTLSSGSHETATIGSRLQDALDVFDRLTEGPQIVIGSSMGGWIMLNVALARPSRVAALVGIAAAPDFTEAIWEGLGEDGRATLLREGQIFLPSGYSAAPYPITRRLIEEGRRHLRLSGPIPIARPVRLLHGMRDTDVDWHTALAIAERLDAEDVQVTLVKDGDHRLSRDRDLGLLFEIIARLSDTLRVPGGNPDSAA